MSGFSHVQLVSMGSSQRGWTSQSPPASSCPRSHRASMSAAALCLTAPCFLWALGVPGLFKRLWEHNFHTIWTETERLFSLRLSRLVFLLDDSAFLKSTKALHRETFILAAFTPRATQQSQETSQCRSDEIWRAFSVMKGKNKGCH